MVFMCILKAWGINFVLLGATRDCTFWDTKVHSCTFTKFVKFVELMLEGCQIVRYHG